MKFDIVPGDMIEWVYNSNKRRVDVNEQLYSTVMKQWVSIGRPALLIHIDEHTYSWLSPTGLFHARVDDTQPVGWGGTLLHPVVPHLCG
jgi:hypothetical protein